MLRCSRYVMVVPLFDGDYLLINTRNGAMVMGTEEMRDILQRPEKRMADEKVLDSLVSSGFLTESTPKEETEAALRELESRCELLPEYTLFTLILTYGCNMRCSYCFQSYVFSRGYEWLDRKMSFDQVDAAFKTMELVAPGCRTPVHLFGGEPLMSSNYELVEYVLKRGKSLGKSFIIVTNGLEADTFIPLLTEYPVNSVQISVDGVGDTHDQRKKTIEGTGSFERIVSSIDALVEVGVGVAVRIVYDHTTVRELPSLMNFMREREWISPRVTAYLTPVRHHTPGGCFNFLCNVEKEDLKILLKNESMYNEFWRGLEPLREKLGFTQGWAPTSTYCRHHPAQLWFDPFGDLYFCTDSLGDKEHAVGRYHPDFQYADQYYQWKERTVFEMKSCRHCRYVFICGGGCAHYIYHEKGDLTKPDCTFSRQAVEVYYPLIGEMIKKFRKMK
jgi:uncharacterized protein